ncbi:hypothetical protein BCR34DRAFT_657528 [Clohesyomyces aquaticus]|uniref:Major facilitator superfamily domain-containing protein n=1 Tax=Clohesyomyces aquaticus TaxID=1231657 RepID=A0A1Y1ZG86_9PLEO|nr:hypothetical protein BCR34DRAFT_657528 [Clohesyomyces aquaticus]
MSRLPFLSINNRKQKYLKLDANTKVPATANVPSFLLDTVSSLETNSKGRSFINTANIVRGAINNDVIYPVQHAEDKRNNKGKFLSFGYIMSALVSLLWTGMQLGRFANLRGGDYTGDIGLMKMSHEDQRLDRLRNLTMPALPTTLSLGEWFSTKNRICNRSIAYGICLSTKNIVGSTCPFIFHGLLDRKGFRATLLIWCALTIGISIISILMTQTPASSTTPLRTRGRKIPWKFLCHRPLWIYNTATLL